MKKNCVGLNVILLATAVLAFLPCRSLFADTVRVTTVRELIKAIAPDRAILLSPGTYNLMDAAGLRNKNVSWEEVFDGRELHVKNVENLDFFLCTILENTGSTVFDVDEASRVSFAEGEISENSVDQFLKGPVTISSVQFHNNSQSGRMSSRAVNPDQPAS